MQIAHDGRPSPADLDHIYVSSVTGAMVPLSQITATSFTSSPTMVDHRDRQRSVTVTSYVHSGYNTDAVTKAVMARLEAVPLPPQGAP